MAKKPETNVQFVKRLMEHSEYGAMAQIFIIHCIECVSKQTVETPLTQEQLGGFFHAASWNGVAKEIHDAITNRGK